MSQYQLATTSHPGPQTIPDGFAGQFDWPAIDDAEKARRGWVRFDPPRFDPVFERVETAFAKAADGLWVANYTVVPGAIAPALAVAKDRVAAHRWSVQVGGVAVTVGGKPTRFLSTKEGQTDIGNALQLGMAADAQTGSAAFAMTWKSLDGFVTLKVADLTAIGMAIGLHVAACFAREAAIDEALEEAATAPGATAYAVRDLLAAELHKGWPA